MLALAAVVSQAAEGECTAYLKGALGAKRHEVRVSGDLVFPAYGLWWNGVPPPLFALGDDRASAWHLTNALGKPIPTRRVATFDPETHEIRGRGVLAAIGGVDLEAGEAWLGAHVVKLEGDCSATDGLLAVLGSRRVRAPK